MRKVPGIMLAGLFLTAVPAGLQAQVFRTYHGCGKWACLWTEWLGYTDGAPGPNVFYSTDAFFFAPDGLGGTLPSYWTRFVTYYEAGWAGYSDYGEGDPEPPKFWVESVRYGPVGVEWPEGEVWAETIFLKPTLTPEPASLILALSGLAGLGVIYRRRRTASRTG